MASDAWCLEKGVTFLNHGSFGSCPRPVLQEQSRLRERMEAQPVRFFMRELPELLDAARGALAGLVGADADDLAFVPNASTGVSTVLGSLTWSRGDELLVTDHAYAACRNQLDAAAARDGAEVVVAEVPFPLDAPSAVMEVVLSRVTARTRFALIDHVTSPTALVLPLADLVRELEGRGIPTLVDGAHAPGMLPLDLRALGASFYTGNCHKWLCAPKGAAFLHVREDFKERIHPLTLSHGATAALEGRSRFRVEFDWIGTDDQTAVLCIPAAIDFLSRLVPGGLAAHMERNRELALTAQQILGKALQPGRPLPAPPQMIGSMAAFPIPDARTPPPTSPFGTEALQARLLARFGIEVPIFGWPRWPRRIVRVSAQAYNRPADYELLAGALPSLLS